MDKIMSMKKKTRVNKEIGAELVKRFQDFNENIESIMGKSAKLADVAKSATTQTFDIVDDELTLTMNVMNSNKIELFSFDLYDNFLNEYWEMNLSREKLKGVADFILKYLEQY